jgi:excisionase family DNA binding protein
MGMEQWLSKKQAAAIACVDPKTIDRAIAKHVLKRARNGVNKVLIAYSDLDRWMKGGDDDREKGK